MADCRTGLSRSEDSSLKETLCVQQKLLQKLSSELDAEREASATAASEALSVILRLQGEKAAVKMEAEQYKRLAEEKICHAEESFAVIEDIITQKEMEVAALEYQVQTYRYKLSTMGCHLGGGEVTHHDTLLLMNEHSAWDSGSHNLGRTNSAPVCDKYMKFVNEEKATSPMSHLSRRTVVEEENDREIRKSDAFTPNEGFTSYGEEVKKLDSRVKEIAGDNYTSFMTQSQGIGRQPDSNTFATSLRNSSSAHCPSDREPMPCVTTAEIIEVQDVNKSTSRVEEKHVLSKIKEQLSSLHDTIVSSKSITALEELQLFKEIEGTLSFIQDRNGSRWNARISSHWRYQHLESLLHEAMLSFWL